MIVADDLRRLRCLSTETHRYWLRRGPRAGTALGHNVLFVMLNPSTADADLDDPTIRRCVGFADALDAEFMGVVNLFSVRATDPKELRSGILNTPVSDAALEAAAIWADTVIFGFGAVQGHIRGDWFQRVADVDAIFRSAGKQPQALALTKDGWPRHPLYLSKSLRPEPWHWPNGARP